jgi:hypothetical protein
MAYEIKRTDKEIDDLLNRVGETINEGTSRYRGMTYEEGVAEAVRWLLGETDDHPYEEE